MGASVFKLTALTGAAGRVVAALTLSIMVETSDEFGVALTLTTAAEDASAL